MIPDEGIKIRRTRFAGPGWGGDDGIGSIELVKPSRQEFLQWLGDEMDTYVSSPVPANIGDVLENIQMIKNRSEELRFGQAVLVAHGNNKGEFRFNDFYVPFGQIDLEGVTVVACHYHGFGCTMIFTADELKVVIGEEGCILEFSPATVVKGFN